MERELTVLLVEDDREACEEIHRYIDTKDDVKLIGTTNDSTEALEMVKVCLPDAVILDLELHLGGGNGLLFLLGLNQLDLPVHPYILITTNNSSNITYETARQMGADFIIAKYETSYSAQYVVEFLRMTKNVILKHSSPSPGLTEPESEEQHQRKLIQRIHRELDFVGISPKAVGYNYLTDTILMLYHDSGANISRILGEKYHKSDFSIERAMQNAINRAWRLSDPDDLLNHYTARISSERGVPTLMEFVFYYAKVLKDEF